MNSKIRLAMFLLSGCGLLAIFAAGVSRLHPAGDVSGGPAAAYSDFVSSVAIPERHITNAVAAVNLDIRSFDTMIEVYIVLASVLGALLLLRRHPDELAPAGHRQKRGRTTRTGLAALVAIFGIYLVVHGQVTRGGGFSGGVVLAAAPLIYVGGDFEALRRMMPRYLGEIVAATGAAGYLLIGAYGLLVSTAFLHNLLPLGEPGGFFSGGTVPLLNVCVGLGVSGGLIALMQAFLGERPGRRDRV